MFIIFFGNNAPWICIYLAAAHISTGSLSLLLSLVPFFTLIIAFSVRIENFNYLRVLGLLLGFYSVYLLIVSPKINQIGSSNIWMLLGTLAPLFISAVNVLIANDRFKSVDSLTITLGMNLLVAIMLAPFVIFKVSSYFLFWDVALTAAIFTVSLVVVVGTIVFMKLLKSYAPVFARLIT